MNRGRQRQSDMVVITSWNEFVENTYIDPSAQFGSQLR